MKTPFTTGEYVKYRDRFMTTQQSKDGVDKADIINRLREVSTVEAADDGFQPYDHVAWIAADLINFLRSDLAAEEAEIKRLVSVTNGEKFDHKTETPEHYWHRQAVGLDETLIDANKKIQQQEAEIERLNVLVDKLERANTAEASRNIDNYKKIEQLNARVNSILRLDTPWPLLSVLQNLCETSAILLDDKNYDGTGWEILDRARREAQEIINTIINHPGGDV